jgi:hypothetical protein
VTFVDLVPEWWIDFLERERRGDPAAGYERDPKLGPFCGWPIKRLGDAPAFNQSKMFPGPMITLWHYPDPELPKPRKPRVAKRG